MAAAAGSASWEQLARAAADTPAPPAGAAPREYLRVELAGTGYALPIEPVREVVRPRPPTPLPRAPQSIRGVVALRGEMVQVLDLRTRLGLAAPEPRRGARLVVVTSTNGATALLVDGVQSVLRVDASAVRAIPEGEDEPVSALLACEDGFVSVLDLERLLELGDA